MMETTVIRAVSDCWEEAVAEELRFMARNANTSTNGNAERELKLLFLFDLRPHFPLKTFGDDPAMEKLLGHRMVPIGCHAIRCLKEMGVWDEDRMIELLISKQRDYGHGNIMSFGLFGVAVRMSDKLERLKNLLGRGIEPANETLEDTVMDLVGYATIASMLLGGTFELPLKENL